jgi:dGTPase
MTVLRAFLYRRMYRHARVASVMERAQNLLTDLFDAFMARPSLLPNDWVQRCGEPGGVRTARAVCDYIAGMTDNFASQEYRRLFHAEFPL